MNSRGKRIPDRGTAKARGWASTTSSNAGKNVGFLGKGGGARRAQSVGKRGPR